MVVKLNTKPIGLTKSINVKANVRNVDLADEMLIRMLELDSKFAEIDDDSPNAMLESLKMERDFTAKAMGFLKTILKLDDKQVDKVAEHVDFKGLGSYIPYVCNRIKGMSEKDYQEAMKESAPKETAPAPEETSTN